MGGIRKGRRCTERGRRYPLWACERFGDRKAVRDYARRAAGLLYAVPYAELERRRRTRLYPWPKAIRIDEHLRRRGNRRYRSIATVVTDIKSKRLMEVADGSRVTDLNGKSRPKRVGFLPMAGRDGTRTRGLRRDRPAL